VLVYLLIAAVVSGPFWIALCLIASRRKWRQVRKLSRRARGQEQLVELAQLAGGLAHEIKNPLSTINVNLELLTEDLSRLEGDENRRILNRLAGVRGEVERLRRILEDFLHYARKYELDLQPTDVRRLIEELTDFFAPQADAAKVILRTSLPQEPLVCALDATLIKQAILNLLVNAVQAMPDGGELLVRVSRRRGFAVIEVIDTGRGIEPQKLSKIFDVYYSTKPDGSGLGLPTTRRIIREHHGSIRAQSEPGKGTRFIVSLPLHEG